METDTKINKKTLWDILKVLLAIILALYILAQVRVEELSRTWQRISFIWLLANTLIFAASVWCMARRYWLLIGKQTTFRELLGLTVVQTAVGNLVATSAGAASFVVFLRGRYQVHMAKSVGSLLLSRFFDMLVLLVALAASSWVVWKQITNLHWPLMLLLAVLSSAAICLPIIYVFRAQLIWVLSSLSVRLKLNRSRMISRIFVPLDRFAAQDPAEARNLIGEAAILSCLIFLLNLGFAYSSVRIFGISIGVWPIIFMLSLTQLVALVPIQVSGGLGVFDVTILYLYGLFGFSQAEMAAVIIGWRIIYYVLSLLLLLYLPIDSRLSWILRNKLSSQ